MIGSVVINFRLAAQGVVEDLKRDLAGRSGVTWRDVLQRDLRSVYRSRTGTAVAVIVVLAWAVAAPLFGRWYLQRRDLL